jgi:DNA invertase Pin-like site-specific DNA recombinase
MIIDGYVRVSQVKGRRGESFISPALQREQIVNWAKLNGAVVATVFEELAESGARSDRPKLMKALARVEEGLTDGIVVAKLDRFGRSLLGSLAAIERIRAAGGTFVAVQDGLDVTTDTGKLVLRIMLSMAEWELDRIRAQWNAARERAVARGVHLGAYPPTGYIRDSNRLLHPDPVSGPVIAELFARRAQGATMRELGLFLSEQKVRTRLDNPNWISTALHSLITNRVYLGELRHGTMINSERAAHRSCDMAGGAEPAGDRPPRDPSFTDGPRRAPAVCRLPHGHALSNRDDTQRPAQALLPLRRNVERRHLPVACLYQRRGGGALCGCDVLRTRGT